jgi:hypothetical protein
MSGDVISEESQTIEDKSKEVAVDAPDLMDAHIPSDNTHCFGVDLRKKNSFTSSSKMPKKL